jgi:hypothetical protein
LIHITVFGSFLELPRHFQALSHGGRSSYFGGSRHGVPINFAFTLFVAVLVVAVAITTIAAVRFDISIR